MALLSNSEVIWELMKALGLPKHVKWFELRAEADEVVTIKCEYMPEPFTLEDDQIVDVTSLSSTSKEYRVGKRGFKTLIKNYKLVEK